MNENGKRTLEGDEMRNVKRPPRRSSGAPIDDASWDSKTHRSFVECIFQTGLQQSSPSVILDEMKLKTADVTSERVKSHLQKFRSNKEKSLAEFMDSYDNSMAKYGSLMQNIPENCTPADIDKYSVKHVTESKSKLLLSGEVAARLSMVGMLCPSSTSFSGDTPEPEPLCSTSRQVSEELSVANPMSFMMKYIEGQSSNVVELPMLNEEEKNSSLGSSLCYIMGLFFSMKQHILDQREKDSQAPPTTAQQKTSAFTTDFDPTQADDMNFRVSPPLDSLESAEVGYHNTVSPQSPDSVYPNQASHGSDPNAPINNGGAYDKNGGPGRDVDNPYDENCVYQGRDHPSESHGYATTQPHHPNYPQQSPSLPSHNQLSSYKYDYQTRDQSLNVRDPSYSAPPGGRSNHAAHEFDMSYDGRVRNFISQRTSSSSQGYPPAVKMGPRNYVVPRLSPNLYEPLDFNNGSEYYP